MLLARLSYVGYKYLKFYYRYGTPKDCSGTVSFLVSDDASYITGETIVMAGGMTSRL